MKPLGHVVTSVPAGLLVWFVTKSLGAGISCLVFGTLFDFDHIIDYFLNFGTKEFTLRRCYQASAHTGRDRDTRGFHKVYIFFHSFEIALVLLCLLFITKNILLFGACIGYWLHLVLDSIANPIGTHSYFFTWRALNRFDVQRLVARH